MGKYYDLIMSPLKDSYTYCFNQCWQNQLNKLEKPYSDAIQLRIGNHLRAKLTCWGAALNADCVSDIDLNRVAVVSSYIEMLHKASIIIDDVIDDDDARHSQKAFHIEFGKQRAFIFSMALLARGMSGINEVFKNTNCHYNSINLYSNTIYNMAVGCIEELSLDTTSRYDIERIRKIISLETIELIKNSFVLGFWATSDSPNNPVENRVIEIGENCGYMFQVLNDLEPFSSEEKNRSYKGGRNIDLNRDRKNYIVSYIFGAATQIEKQNLLTLTGQELHSYVMTLYEKYSVLQSIISEVRSIQQQTDRQIINLQSVGVNDEYIEDFRKFVSEMIEICFSRL